MTLDCRDRVVAGGDGDFMAVRHLRMRGTQHDIGRHLARIARDELGVRKLAWTDPFVTRTQRQFLRRNWPAHMARVAGAAAGFGADAEDDRLDFSFLAYDMGVPGCSCVFYPASLTADGHSVLSRNFDYTTGGYGDLPIGNSRLDHLVQQYGAAADRPYVGRPFLLETYPDVGYATLGMCAFDLLGMLTDGVNSEGLAVALLNDGETLNGPLWEPLATHGVGLSEGQVPRFLLETCATAEEALMALLATKQYYVTGPCHYLVGDRTGRAFVWEYSSVRNRHHVIEAAGAPLPVTNHLLHEHQPLNPDSTQDSMRRLGILRDGIDATQGGFSRERIRGVNRAAHATLAVGEGQYQSATHPTRTLWQAQYDLDAAGVDIDFYLGESEGAFRRSPVLSFQLERDPRDPL